MRFKWPHVLPAFAGLAFCGLAQGGSIILTGSITQSTADTGVPATQNLSLNNIADGDAYTAQLSFNAGINMPGTFSLTSLSFIDSTAGATETAFISGSLTITQVGAIDQFDVLGCLADCALGNQFALEFSIPALQLNSSVAASAIPALLPMDLLEDDGSTDIQGSVQQFTYQGPVSAKPEPGVLCLVGVSLLTIGAVRRKLRTPVSLTKRPAAASGERS